MSSETNSKQPKRLVLFDIDGTLILGGPLWKECFLAAMNHYFPDIQFPSVSFNGKTDVQIAREMMEQKGFNQEQLEDYMHRIVDDYVSRAIIEVQTRSHEIKILPGVRELLEKIAKREDMVVGLLTGNVRRGADAKLASVGLQHFFTFGVFGDDHWDRYQLPPMAVGRVLEVYGHIFSGKEIVIIGDTIHDVNCGKSIGVRSIAVGTGRGVDIEELLAQDPDYYFKDLSNTDEVIQAILEEI